MATLNKVMLMGRLTNEPEERTIASTGTRVVKFGFAVGRSRKDPATGQWQNDPNPMFIDCEAFTVQGAKRDLVNLIKQYCHKGDPLYIEGRLQFDQWDDKQSGQKRSKHKIVVENIEFLGSRGEDGGSGGGAGRSAGAGGSRQSFSDRSAPMAPPPEEGGGHDGGGHDGGGHDGGGTDDPIPF